MNSQRTRNVITIDGPSASGKSSVSREVAARLGWKWVSTGAFYRGLAAVALEEKVPFDDVSRLVDLSRSSIWKVAMEPLKTSVVYKGRDISERVFSERMGESASQISQLKEVRRALLEAQRNCAVGVPGLIAEGRDCGTVVFPEALLKIFITASQEARAQRRATQSGENVQVIQASQIGRDQQDSSRKVAPLQVAEGSRVLDTNHLTLGESVETVCRWAEEALKIR